MKLTGKSIWVGSGFVISGVCLWLFLRNIEWGQVGRALKEAEYFYVIPSLLVSFLVYILRALRWRSLLSEVKKASFLNLLSATFIGFMANHLLPARVGEIVRAVVIGKKENISMPTAFATIVMERLFDSVSLIIVATVVFAFIPCFRQSTAQNPAVEGNLELQNSHFLLQLKSGVGIMGAVCVVSLVFFILLDLYSKRVIDLTGRLLFFLPCGLKEKLLRILESFVPGLKILRNTRQVIWLSLLSFGMWFVGILSVYILSLSFGIGVPITGMSLVVVCTSLAVAMPQAPGYVGVYHLAVLKSLELFHVDVSVAQSFAIVLWTIGFFLPIVMGSFFLWREGLSFSQVLRETHPS
jgi:uncharacterized protein (TIRG00374 family)